jgi:hypothetical protein
MVRQTYDQYHALGHARKSEIFYIHTTYQAHLITRLHRILFINLNTISSVGFYSFCWKILRIYYVAKIRRFA